MFICNLRDHAAPQSPQKNRNLAGLHHFHSQAHIVLFNRGYLLKARWAHENMRWMSLTQLSLLSQSFPPSFFPLNCNLLSLLPLHLPVLISGDAFSVTQCANCTLCIYKRRWRESNIFGSHVFLLSAAHPSPKKTPRWDKCLQDGCLALALLS